MAAGRASAFFVLVRRRASKVRSDAAHLASRSESSRKQIFSIAGRFDSMGFGLVSFEE
jgi:hypothetical protein